MQVRKEKVRVTISIREGLWVEGDWYILPGSRITDIVNIKQRDFFPLTDCNIIDIHTNEVLKTAEFLLINRETIDLIIPHMEGK